MAEGAGADSGRIVGLQLPRSDLVHQLAGHGGGHNSGSSSGGSVYRAASANAALSHSPSTSCGCGVGDWELGASLIFRRATKNLRAALARAGSVVHAPNSRCWG